MMRLGQSTRLSATIEVQYNRFKLTHHLQMVTIYSSPFVQTFETLILLPRIGLRTVRRSAQKLRAWPIHCLSETASLRRIHENTHVLIEQRVLEIMHDSNSQNT